MKKSDVKIITNNEGIQIFQKDGKDFGIDWQEISSIKVFKRDLITFDEICMEIKKTDGKSVEFNEEMSGWDGFVNIMPSYLKGSVSFESWYPEVSQPPFARSEKEIYSKKSHAV